MKIVLADPHRLVIEGIRGTLAESDGMSVVGEAHCGEDLLSVVARRRPDAVVTELSFPDLDGLECIRRMRQRHPEVKVVVLSADISLDQVRAALTAGAAAYIAKSVDPSHLAAAVRHALDGTVYHAPPEGFGAERPSKALDLTERELTMLQGVAQGLSNKAISREHWVTEQTVKFHLNNVYRKLGVSNRTAAARYAHEHGLANAG